MRNNMGTESSHIVTNESKRASGACSMLSLPRRTGICVRLYGGPHERSVSIFNYRFQKVKVTKFGWQKRKGIMNERGK